MVVTLGFSEYLELDFENFKQKWDHNTWEAEFKVTQGYTVRPDIKKKLFLRKMAVTITYIKLLLKFVIIKNILKLGGGATCL